MFQRLITHVSIGRFNFELCAELHNQIFEIAWKGSGRTWGHLPTWWQHFQPTDAQASHYHPWMIEFLQRVYYHPDAPPLFYYIDRLASPEDLVDEHVNGLAEARDCFLWLHHSTGWMCGDEYGILFDQVACKATFVTHCEDNLDRVRTGYGWKPLEDIYCAYLAMIASRKVEVRQWPSGRWEWDTDTDKLAKSPLQRFGPWRFHTYTPTDVQLAVFALRDLLDAIEARLPPTATIPNINTRSSMILPWSDPGIRDEARIIRNSFAGAFCDATATICTTTTRRCFQYLAPGIRLPTIAEFRAQPFRDYEYADSSSQELFHLRPIRPTLLLVADHEGSLSLSSLPSPLTPPMVIPDPDITINSILFSRRQVDLPVPARPAGLYLSGDDNDNRAWESGCHLLLPFSIGEQGWVRRSDGTIMGTDYADDIVPRPGATNSELYQCVENGCVPYRHVPIHQVLQNWAERVREGDWAVDENGVSGGIGKWREADTEEMWEKYCVPLKIY
ncbi:uncharacterized protein BO72DRAFT_524778 [Aspergillus fijiensis CBS 313.89]|uniref:Uncharacterized protein n=1 Tax=Aspergillus fijiensis CBS 313.89 TaxID=1448319 RepID=A0A8G1S024_9EURO|nr:uncharacterized protein BO72DRAFT_524778 [Aspergillus fijiensis CBS 313.89]RAK80816.1 hypothetical protein BO72DRAFT_524778 [Aspergillus fijiensis CBS 313.89]